MTDSNAVIVSLIDLNGDREIPTRTIALSHKNNSVSIGRASKTVNKGILAAADNAWFDSPVMSRNHAKLKLDSNTKVYRNLQWLVLC
jgi:pSer/pThr/pTyr-binding forkhead associated (FHA) protein